MNTGFVVLSRDPLVRGEVVNAGATASQLYLVARDADELLATIGASRPRAVIIDREYGEADDVLRRLSELPERDRDHAVPRHPRHHAGAAAGRPRRRARAGRSATRSSSPTARSRSTIAARSRSIAC